MIKVVYLDEGSITDFICVLSEGKTVDKEEHIVRKTAELAADAGVQANNKLVDRKINEKPNPPVILGRME
jgi:hypothetical protein